MRRMLRTPPQGGEEEYAIYSSSPPRNGVRIIFLNILSMVEGGWRMRSRLHPPSRGGNEEYSSPPPHDEVHRVLLIFVMKEYNLFPR
jgi:hypothetical protein